MALYVYLLIYLQAEVKAALEKVCALLPSTIKQECDDFVKQYADLVVQLLVHELDPTQVCTALQLCQSQTVVGKVIRLIFPNIY